MRFRSAPISVTSDDLERPKRHAQFSPKFLMGFCSDESCECRPMYLPHLKFVALPVPVIIGDTQKFGQSLDTPTLPFLSKF